MSKTKIDISETVYRLIENPNSDLAASTKTRNELVAYGVDHRPLTNGLIWNIASENLGGGLWRCWAEVSR